MLRSSRTVVSLLGSLLMSTAVTTTTATVVLSSALVGCQDESQPEYWTGKLSDAAWKARAVKRLAAQGDLAMIVVEQNTRLALDIAPRAVVMDRGRIVYDGASETLRNDPAKLEKLIGVVKA